MKPSFDEA